MGVGSDGSLHCRPSSWKLRRWGSHSVPCAIGDFWRAAVASLDYVMAGWLRWRRLTVASVGTDRGSRGFCPRLLPRQAGGLGPGDLLSGGGRLGRRSGGMPWLHSGGRFPVYLVHLWALFSGVRRRMGWALLSCRLSPCGLSGALLPWSASFWRCQVTRICTPPLGPGLEAVLDRDLERSSRPCGRCRKGCWTFVPFWNSGYVSGWGGACSRREDDEDAWSRWGGGVQRGGRRVSREGREVCRAFRGCCPAVFSGLFGARGGCTSFPPHSLWRDWRWLGWGGVGLGEGVRCLLARVL